MIKRIKHVPRTSTLRNPGRRELEETRGGAVATSPLECELISGNCPCCQRTTP